MNPNMKPTQSVFESNVKKALECADNVIQSANETLAIATSTPTTNVLTSEKNVKTILDELELAAVAPTQAALNKPTMEETGNELKKIMTAGFDDFFRQTGRQMSYSEMRYAYG